MNNLSSFLTVAALIAGSSSVSAQVTRLLPEVTRSVIYNYTPVDSTLADSIHASLDALEFEAPEMNEMFFDGVEMVQQPDSIHFPGPEDIEYVDFNPYPLPTVYLRPTVFDRLHILPPYEIDPHIQLVPGVDHYATEWASRSIAQAQLMERTRQRYIVNYPHLIQYDEAHLPEPPKKFTATVDPATARILITEVIAKEMPVANLEAKFEKKHWLKTFNANLQFSQAYVSPNWYQGGNNNLNALMNAYYNVKLNPAFHPNLLFENTLQYKLGMNNAPDDEMHDYNISEDIFQWNMTAGYKANKRWYYSMNTQFKTQILNNYKPNSNTLKAAFMSPGELNIGLGMTYNYANKNKTFTFDASISPLSYNLKTCTRGRMKETSFGIEEGRKTVSEYGSNAEGKLTWQILENISLRSRLFVFSDYDYIQSDWENTIQFTVNRFLSTQIYVHMRYDSTSPVIEDTDWHKFQFKEILSFGFTYKFGN